MSFHTSWSVLLFTIVLLDFIVGVDEEYRIIKHGTRNYEVYSFLLFEIQFNSCVVLLFLPFFKSFACPSFSDGH